MKKQARGARRLEKAAKEAAARQASEAAKAANFAVMVAPLLALNGQRLDAAVLRHH
jgi:hypothetical protein